MPIVQNILHVQGGSAQAAALFDFIADRRYGRGSVDRSRITPMPPWICHQPTNRDLLGAKASDFWSGLQVHSDRPAHIWMIFCV